MINRKIFRTLGARPSEQLNTSKTFHTYTLYLTRKYSGVHFSLVPSRLPPTIIRLWRYCSESSRRRYRKTEIMDDLLGDGLGQVLAGLRLAGTRRSLRSAAEVQLQRTHQSPASIHAPIFTSRNSWPTAAYRTRQSRTADAAPGVACHPGSCSERPKSNPFL